MKCSYCGKRIKNNIDECPYCGNALNDNEDDLLGEVSYESDNASIFLDIIMWAIGIVFIIGFIIFINRIIGICLLLSGILMLPISDLLMDRLFAFKTKTWIKIIIVSIVLLLGSIFDHILFSVESKNKSYSDDEAQYYSPNDDSDNYSNSNVINYEEYNGCPYFELNNNVPTFKDDIYYTEEFEMYGDFDSLGRCTYGYACLNANMMPIIERGSIGMIKPTGWHTIRYDNIDQQYLYNRCHLIGYQLTGQNANEHNLITGTRYMNVEGMLPFENKVASYLRTNPDKHVLYRVTPVFDNDNLLADGVVMEAMSIEDDGEGIMFNVFCYNVQPGIIIDYSNGESYSNVANVISVN